MKRKQRFCVAATRLANTRSSKMEPRILSFAIVLFAVFNMLVETSSAQIGETLQQFEARYGSAKLLPTPDTISAKGIKAYEFRRAYTITIVALIGDRAGAVQVSYYTGGEFSTSEVFDLIQCNSSDSEPPDVDGPFEPDHEPSTDALQAIGFMRQVISMSDIDAEWFVGADYSRLTVSDALKMVKQSDGVGLIDYSKEFAVEYHEKLESEVIRCAPHPSRIND